MNGYQCWFCGNGIEREDTGALIINVGNVWQWDRGARKDDPWQSIYAHSKCARERLKGATMEIEPELFGDDG